MPDVSWVIVEKKTGTAVFETFDFELCQFVNVARYLVIPSLAYLASLAAREQK